MSANLKYDSIHVTEAEYLAFERDSEIRHEYIQGEVVAMAGASPNHNRITMTLSYLLYGHLRGKKGCEVYGENMRVKIEAVDIQTYPDFSVVCGDIQLTDDTPQAILNPILLIEVLSPSTEKYDRGKKFSTYRQLPSLQEYVLVSQDSPHIERFFRKSKDIWEFSDTTGLEETFTLSSIDCILSLADVYENVIFEAEPPKSEST